MQMRTENPLPQEQSSPILLARTIFEQPKLHALPPARSPLPQTMSLNTHRTPAETFLGLPYPVLATLGPIVFWASVSPSLHVPRDDILEP